MQTCSFTAVADLALAKDSGFLLEGNPLENISRTQAISSQKCGLERANHLLTKLD